MKFSEIPLNVQNIPLKKAKYANTVQLNIWDLKKESCGDTIISVPKFFDCRYSYVNLQNLSENKTCLLLRVEHLVCTQTDLTMAA